MGSKFEIGSKDDETAKEHDCVFVLETGIMDIHMI